MARGVDERIGLESSVAVLGHAREEEVVVEHLLAFEHLGAHPRDAVAHDGRAVDDDVHETG